MQALSVKQLRFQLAVAYRVCASHGLHEGKSTGESPARSPRATLESAFKVKHFLLYLLTRPFFCLRLSFFT